MGSDFELLEKYIKLKEEFETYQNFTEKMIKSLNSKNIEVEKKLDALTNIVEISKYINSFISDDNLIPMINDMILGILGVTYSSIYLEEKEELVVKASNIKSNFSNVEVFNQLRNGKPFIINCKESIFQKDFGKEEIHSLIGVPITLREKFMGYIILQHTLCDFFDYEHMKFISSIANQIGIALENNMLYTKIKEASIKDPLLGIFNRKYFFGLVEDLIIKQPNKKFAIVMVDFDNFKKVNDIYGHQYGDEVLIQTTNLISNLLSKDDVIARYGGEEIIMYIDDCSDYEKVYRKIDDIRIRISENKVVYNEISISVTASFGLGFYLKEGTTLQSVISIADSMLYQSKKLGKNRVTKNV